MATHRSYAEQARHYFARPHHEVPAGPIVSPANWRGRDMARRTDEWLYILSDIEIAELSAAVECLIDGGVEMSAVSRTNAPLPMLGDTISKWRDEIASGRGFVTVRGMPVDSWGAEKSAFAYWLIGHYLGVPGAQNPQGELLGHVIDYGEEASNPIVRRYRTTGNIDFHCDGADAVGLLCLRTAKSGGQSRIVSSVAIFNEVMRREPDLIARLFEPFSLDLRGENRDGTPGFVSVQPCCFSREGHLRTFYHSEYYRSADRLPDVSIDRAQRRLLDLYDELCLDGDFQLDMWLEPGDMQFISNHTILHSRTEYDDWSEPDRKRHLLRLWLSF